MEGGGDLWGGRVTCVGLELLLGWPGLGGSTPGSPWFLSSPRNSAEIDSDDLEGWKLCREMVLSPGSLSEPPGELFQQQMPGSAPRPPESETPQVVSRQLWSEEPSS